MKLIFIYGAPASGKLTIAKEISKVTGYKIFHNHLTLDFLDEIFGENKKGFWEAVDEIRLTVFEKAARSKIKGLIFTYGSINHNNFEFLKKVIERIEKYKGKVCLVNTKCSEKELLKRIKSKSRKEYNKLKNSKELRKILLTWDFETKIPSKKTLEIDTEVLSPKRAAQKIIKYYKLK
ncbi:MAG: AAA family ATPase [Candidatus Nanoarchaeia archaeon]|nr:AAA family ATPase [Candidatus Nanoarchaeia archaeon]